MPLANGHTQPGEGLSPPHPQQRWTYPLANHTQQNGRICGKNETAALPLAPRNFRPRVLRVILSHNFLEPPSQTTSRRYLHCSATSPWITAEQLVIYLLKLFKITMYKTYLLTRSVRHHTRDCGCNTGPMWSSIVASLCTDDMDSLNTYWSHKHIERRSTGHCTHRD
jgi:hypothetical protein